MLPGNPNAGVLTALPFELAIIMLGLSAALFGTRVDANGPRWAMVVASSCFVGGLPDLGAGLLHRPVLAGRGRLRVRRRDRARHRLHLAGVHADQVVPGPAGPLHGHRDHGLRRGRADRVAADHAAAHRVRRHREGRDGGGRRPDVPRMGILYAIFMSVGWLLVRVPPDGWRPAGWTPPTDGRAGGQVRRLGPQRDPHPAVLAALGGALLQRHGGHRHPGAGGADLDGLLPATRPRPRRWRPPRPGSSRCCRSRT